MRRILFPAMLLTVLLTSGVVLATGCSPRTETPSKATANTAIKDVTPREAADLIRTNQGKSDFSIIDVRTAAEFGAGRIRDATNVDFYSQTFQADMDRLDKDRTYLVYCASGRRSQSAVEIMEKLGFKRVYNVLGGIQQWEADGLPTVK